MYLNCHSYYSLRHGVFSIDKLLETAKTYGIKRFALTDINNTSGWFELLQYAKEYDVSPIAGIDFRNDYRQLYVGIAKNNDGFAELNRFLSKHLQNKEPFPATAPEFENAFVIYPFNPSKQYTLKNNEYIGVKKSDLTKFSLSPVKKYTNNLIALNTVTVQDKKDFNAHRILKAIEGRTIITKLDLCQLCNTDEKFYTYDTLQALFCLHPYLLSNTEKLLDRCSFDFEFHQNKNISKYSDNAKNDVDLLIQLTYDGKISV